MKPKTAPVIIAVLIPLVSVAVALFLVYFKKKNFSGIEEFSYPTFIQEPKNLAGNKYIMNAELEMLLANFGPQGRLVSVKESKNGGKLAVLIPENLSTNIVTKQRYEMSVSVGSKGQLKVDSMRKY